MSILIIDCLIDENSSLFFRAEDERENAMHVIAVDAMGGDNAPQAIVEGVNQALSDFKDIEIQLYGDETKLKTYLTASERVSIPMKK